jgi:hypothetical protein
MDKKEAQLLAALVGLKVMVELRKESEAAGRFPTIDETFAWHKAASRAVIVMLEDVEKIGKEIAKQN